MTDDDSHCDEYFQVHQDDFAPDPPSINQVGFGKKSNTPPFDQGGQNWPQMDNLSLCKRDSQHSGSKGKAEDSYMMVVDSGADVGVCRDSSLMKLNGSTITLSSFTGELTPSVPAGGIGGVFKFRGRVSKYQNLGFGGLLGKGTTINNLVSLPQMRKLGFRFILEAKPYFVTPDGENFPLYVKSNGYLGIRVYPGKGERTSANDSENHTRHPARVNALSNDIRLWHRRCAHVPLRVLKYMAKHKLVKGLPDLVDYSEGKLRCPCISCGLGKSTAVHIGPINHTDAQRNRSKAKEKVVDQEPHYPLEQIHMDVCEMDVKDIHGHRYFLVILCRCTDYFWIILLTEKKDMWIKFAKWLQTVVVPYHAVRNRKLAEVLKEKTGSSEEPIISGLRTVRSDCGTEFLNEKMRTVINKVGAKVDPVAPYKKDGRAEALIRKVVVATRVALIEANLSSAFWGPILEMQTYVLVRMYVKRVKGIPFTLLNGVRPDVSDFRQPGALAYVNIHKDKKKPKSLSKAYVAILINYDTAYRTYVYYNPSTGQNSRSYHGRIFEQERNTDTHVGIEPLVMCPPGVGFNRNAWFWWVQMVPYLNYPGLDSNRIKAAEQLHSDEIDLEAAFSSKEICTDRPSTEETTDSRIFDSATPEITDWSEYAEAKVANQFLPGNIIRATFKLPSKAYQKVAQQGLNGKPMSEVLSPITGKPIWAYNKNGKPSKFGRADLNYYIKHGYLKIIVPEEQIINEGDNSSEEQSVNAFSQKTEAEFKMLVGRKHEKVRQTGDLESYDDEFHPDPETTEEHEKEVQSNGNEVTLSEVNSIEVWNRPMMDNTPAESFTTSVLLPERVELPTVRELREGTPCEGGTYKDSDGLIHLDYNTRRVYAAYEGDVRRTVHQATVVPEPTQSEMKIPTSARQAMSNEVHPMWKEAVIKELDGLHDMDVMDWVNKRDPCLRGRRVIPSHFVFAAKFTSDVPPKFIKAKARCVVDGNREEDPENPWQHFASTSGATTNRMFDAIAVMRGWSIFTTDCTQAFLNASTDEPIYVYPPKGTPLSDNYVWALKKFLYGLRGAPKAWLQTLTDALFEIGFTAFDDEPCLMRLDSEEGEIIIQVFVDDIKWATAPTKEGTALFKSVLGRLGDKFKMTLGDTLVTSKNIDEVNLADAGITNYLGLRYVLSKDEHGKTVLKVDQTAYIDKIVKRFDLHEGDKTRNTPLPGGTCLSQLQRNLDPGDTDKPKMVAWAEIHSYPMIIGSLIHAMVHTRPDIAYAVSVLSRAMSKPELWHFKGAQHLLLYLKKTRELGITYSQYNMETHRNGVTASVEQHESNLTAKIDRNLTASVDASFADDEETYRSTSGFVVFYGGSPVDYECKRQPLVTMSTMESEYVAASKCVLAILFLHKLLDFMGIEREGPTQVMEDNTACIAITGQPVHRSRSKHIGVKYHKLREACQNGQVKLIQVWTEHQVADVFTKSLSRTDFERLRATLMGEVPFAQMVANHQKTVSKATVKVNQAYCLNSNRLTRDAIPFSVPIDCSTKDDCYSIGAVILGLIPTE